MLNRIESSSSNIWMLSAYCMMTLGSNFKVPLFQPANSGTFSVEQIREILKHNPENGKGHYIIP